MNYCFIPVVLNSRTECHINNMGAYRNKQCQKTTDKHIL